MEDLPVEKSQKRAGTKACKYNAAFIGSRYALTNLSTQATPLSFRHHKGQ